MAAFARRRRSFAMLMLLLLLEEDDDFLYYYLNNVYYGNTEEGSDFDSEEEDDEDEDETSEDVDKDTDDEHGFDENSENEGDDEADVEPKENHEVLWKLFYLWIQSVIKTSSVNQGPVVAKGRKKSSTVEKCQNDKSGRIVEEELFFFILTFLHRIFPTILIFSSPLFLLLAL